MNKLYTACLLLTVVLIASCSHHSNIPLENIHNKKQLDSVMATLPKMQVRVDSSPVRRLEIKLKGDFSFYGQQVPELRASLVNEQLESISFETNKNALKLLTTLEKEYGTGKKEGENATLVWNTTEKKISLSFFSFNNSLLTLSDKEKGNVGLYFNQTADNEITNIYKTLPASGADNYDIETGNAECGYRIFVNGFLVTTHLKARTLGKTNNINQYLVKGRQQLLTVELLPGTDFDGNPRNKLHLESVVHIIVSKYSDLSNQSPAIFDYRTPSVDTTIKTSGRSSEFVRASKFTGKPSALINVPFETAPVIYELPCFAAATDIRNIPDAKEKILAHYRKLQQAYLQKDLKQLGGLLYPLEQSRAIALHLNKPADSQQQWEKIATTAAAIKAMKLTTNVRLVITPDGRFAKLAPVNKEDRFVLSWEDEEHIFPLDYYTYFDNKGEVRFAFN